MPGDINRVLEVKDHIETSVAINVNTAFNSFHVSQTVLRLMRSRLKLNAFHYVDNHELATTNSDSESG